MFKEWEIASVDKALAKELAEECDIDPFVALIAASRGYTDVVELEEFLADEGVFSSCYELPDIDVAASVINEAIDNKEIIAIYGDYDCDGVTATALLYTYLQSRGANVVVYIPDRITEGYGMTKNGVVALKSRDVSLIITVDNGISCYEEIEYAKSLGIKVVVTDHHLPPEKLPEALAVVDPHLQTSGCEFKEICGAVVAFKLVCAIENAEPEEMMFCYGDLAAIGTIGDVMPLTDENRSIVKSGLKSLKENLRPGIVELLKLCNVSPDELDASKVAFSIVPRLNAAGRMGSAERAFKLLVTDSEEEATLLANEIYAENLLRQQTEKDILNSAFEKVEEKELFNNPVIVVSGEDWHLGVIGIVASRLCETYGKPSIVFSKQGDVAFGSGRSIEGFSLYDAINSCSDMLEKFGGHEQAAGITIKTSLIKEFRKRVNEYAYSVPSVYKKLKLDCKLNPVALSVDIAESLKQLEPYGHANPMPVFAIFGVCIERLTSIGNNKHLRILFTKGDTSFQAVRFSVSEDEFEFSIGDVVDIAVTLDINLYNDKEYLSVVIKDIRLNGTDSRQALESLRMFESFSVGKENDYSALIPTREEFAAVYKFLLKKSYGKKAVLYHFAPTINAGKVEVIITALLELGLVEEQQVENTKVFKINTGHQKVDLNNASVIKKLNKMKRGETNGNLL